MSVPWLKQEENGYWYIHWSEGTRNKRCSTRSKDQGAAKVFMANWLLASASLKTTADASTFKVRELWKVYCNKHEIASPKTRVDVWKNLEPAFGDLTPGEITDDVVEDYVEDRMEGRIGQPSVSGTIRKELAHLLACLNWCAKPKRKLITKKDVPDIELPEAGEARDRWLRTEEIQKLFNAAASMLHRGERLSRAEIFLWLALETAARKTAIYQLTWDRVDFESGVIHYNVPGRKLTTKRRASVPISKALRPILERAYREREHRNRAYHERKNDNLVLFNRSDLAHSVTRIAAKAGVPGVTPHVLRHTAATHMARRGVPLWKIAGVLGNSVAMVERVYAKHCPEGLADAVENISGGLLEAAE